MAGKKKQKSARAETTSKVEQEVTTSETLPEQAGESVVKPVEPTSSEEPVSKPETAPEQAGEVVKPVEPVKSEEPASAPADTKTPEAKAPEVATPEVKTPDVKAPEKKEEVKAPAAAPAPEVATPEVKTPDVKGPEKKEEVKTPAPEEKTPAPVATAPEVKTPDVKVPEKKEEVKTPSPEEKTPAPEKEEAKAPAPAPETKVPETKAPDAKPDVKSPEKGSLTETLVTAVEGALVGAGAAAVKQITAKSAGDLKNIEDGLQKELVAETKGGLPSLAEIGGDIVDVVETIGEEIVEGAGIVVKEVKAHPELLAEGVVAAAIGVASLVQPELIVGSVAMIGKMAADRATTTANQIAVEASTHVVNELSKDLNEELAGHAKLEATTIKTDTIKTEKSVDEAAGTLTEKKTKLSVKETTVVLTGGTATATPAEETTREVSKDAKDVKAIEPPSGEKVQVETPTTSEPPKDAKSDAASADPVKKEATADSEKSVSDTGKHSSVVVKSTTKTVSVKIDEDGTITIGTDAPTGSEGKTESEKPAKEAPEEAEKAVDATFSKETEPKAAADVSKSLEKKIDETIKEVKDAAPVESVATAAVPPKESEDSKDASPDPLAVLPAKTTPIVISTVAALVKPVDVSALNKGASAEENSSAVKESLTKINEKLDALANPTSPEKGIKEPQAPTVDTHTHESLAQIHQKLDGLIANTSASTTKATTSPVEDSSAKVTPEQLEKIHTKLDTLLASSEKSVDDSEKNKISETVSKIHIKLDEILLSNAKSVEAVATKNIQDSELATQKDLETLHCKLDKLQEALSIKPKSDEALISVHEKIDKIHSAVLENAKPVEEKKISDEAANTIAQLHEKLVVMQASIDKLTTALAVRFGGDKEPAVPHPASILTPEASGISEAVVKPDEISKAPLEPAFKFPAETSEVAPAVTEGERNETVATEPAAESSDTVKDDNSKKDDTKKDDAKPVDEPTTPKTPVKKHVKRSSVFGGWFG